jgi:KaiC/GvpD/RAD55 family RecA-like ATPase
MRGPRGRGSTVSASSPLPPELSQFLSRSSYSLLIKGEAATGKTILALSILKDVAAAGNYLYLSTRASPSQLFENHPWLSELAPKTERPDTGEQSKGVQSPNRFVDGPDIGELAKTDGPDTGEQSKGVQSPNRFVDARLDEPVPFFERITNELMDVKSPTIVVDSWDPIGMMMKDEALISNMKVLQTWRERAEAKIIILIEDSDNTSFDSLFDGVVALDRYYDDGRIVRMIQLSKLSGVKVTRPSYLFTLDGGVFQSFRAQSPLYTDAQKSGGWTWEKKAPSTGYRELDAVLDGTLPSGTLVHVNIASGVNSGMVLLLLSGILGRGSPRSRAMFFKPFEGIGLEQASSALGDLIPIRQVRPRGRSNGAETWAKSLKGLVKKQKEAKNGKKIVAVVGSEFLLNASGEGDREALLELMKSEIDLSVLVSDSETPIESAARVASVSLKLSDINGTPLLQAQLPWTEYFVITADASNGSLTLRLVPMV